MPVSFKEILDAFEFASAGGDLGAHEAFLCRESGKIYWRFGDSFVGEPDQELPDDIEDAEKYVAIPNQRELDLGKPLVSDFAREHLPDDLDEVYRMFRRRGAYSAFKRLLVRRDALQRWYDFEQKATERALRDWCKENAIDLTD